jgi:hypothetical protein
MRSLGEPLLDDEIDDLIQLGLNDEHKKIDIECKNFSLKFSFFIISIFILVLLDQLLGSNF